MDRPVLLEFGCLCRSFTFCCLSFSSIFAYLITRVDMCNNEMKSYLPTLIKCLVASPAFLEVQRRGSVSEAHYSELTSKNFSLLDIFAGRHSLVCSHAFIQSASPLSLPPPMSPQPGWVYETGILCMWLSCIAHSLTVISASYGFFFCVCF